MADRSARRRQTIWYVVAALVIAVVAGGGYWIFSASTQPSLVSDDGADLVTPEELDAEVPDVQGVE